LNQLQNTIAFGRGTAAVGAQGVLASQATGAAKGLFAGLTAGAQKYEAGRTRIARAGGAARLSDQQKLNNSLLASQDKFQDQSEAAAAEHTRRLLDIEEKFEEDMLAARERFSQSQFDERASFYDQLGGVEDAGLRQAMSAQYESAAAEAARIASEKGADAADAFLAASRAAIEKQAQLQQKINEARDAGDDGTAEYYEGVLALQQQADQRRLDSLRQQGSAIASERDRQLTEEEQKYSEQQAKLTASADQAADRKIMAAQREGKAVDAVNARYLEQEQILNRLGGQGAASGTAAPVTTPTATPVTAPADLGSVVSAINALQPMLDAVKGAITNDTRETVGAIRGVGDRLVR
jgi:hypothetical protein